MLSNHMFSTKKVQEAGRPVGSIEVCSNDIPFGLLEEECRRPVGKAGHPFKGEN
jgi:hypothetical protein